MVSVNRDTHFPMPRPWGLWETVQDIKIPGIATDDELFGNGYTHF